MIQRGVFDTISVNNFLDTHHREWHCTSMIQQVVYNSMIWSPKITERTFTIFTYPWWRQILLWNRLLKSTWKCHKNSKCGESKNFLITQKQHPEVHFTTFLVMILLFVFDWHDMRGCEADDTMASPAASLTRGVRGGQTTNKIIIIESETQRLYK